jgi:UDP-glucose 4-epimerase
MSLEQGLLELIEYIKKSGVKQFNYHLPLEFITEKTPTTWTQKTI